MFCTDIQPPEYFLISDYVPSLLYHSHFIAILLTLTIGLFVYFQRREILEGQLLLSIGILLSFWNIADIMLWVNTDARLVSLVWSFINVLEMLVSATTLYFAYVFLEKKDAPLKYKVLGLALLAPYIALISTSFNIAGFDLASCEAQVGPLIGYYHLYEAVISLWLIGYIAIRIKSIEAKHRREALLFSAGVILFLLSFSGSNVLASATGNWEILHYGLIGAPIFVGFLAYIIVRYQAFEIRLIGAQALVIALMVLVGSQIFFVRSSINFAISAVSFILVAIAGYFLIRSVKREVRQKEQLEELSKHLAETNEQLKRLDNAKSEFVSIASHQLRTPLTAIKGYISLLLEGAYGDVSGEVQDILNKLYIANNRLTQLVENMLNISRIESGRIQYQFADMSIDAILDELRDIFVIAARNRGLEMTFEERKDPLPQIRGDASKLREVFSNIIDNALKYTEKGGVTVSALTQGNSVEVRISDTGIGIEPDEIQVLFRKFSRGRESNKINVAGTGLGLYVGKKFVEAHNGTISIESAGRGKGTTFIIRLPIGGPAI